MNALTNTVARALLSAIGLSTPEPGLVPPRTGRIEDVRIHESSGIARSSLVPGRFWTHNDSGAAPEIFAIDRQGRALSGPVRIEGAQHVDWEDIASDGRGGLWIADLGNNLNIRRDLRLYRVDEPGETIPASLPVRRIVRVRYPDQLQFPPENPNFDCEAIFVREGRVHILTKHRSDLNTRLYRLDDNGTDEEQVLTFVGEARGVGQVTAADLHPDGRRLAVLTYAGIWIFEADAGEENLLAGRRLRRRIPLRGLGQCEGIAWIDETTLLVSNEARELFEIRLDEFTVVNDHADPLPPAAATPSE